MGLFDSYFDPDQFQDSGGLLGRLLSLQPQQDQYQPEARSEPQNGVDRQPAAAPPQPDLGDRLSAGFQSWAHTPVGNPFAALANGITGFNAGQRTDAAGVASAQAPLPSSAPSPDLGDRLSGGFQSWAHTPVGNPFAALANGIAGSSTGQRTDPVTVAQQSAQPGASVPANAQQGLNAQYQALRPLLGDRNAMLAIVHPEMGQTLIAQALAGPTVPGTATDANSPRNVWSGW
jgi:hypothetical protein